MDNEKKKAEWTFRDINEKLAEKQKELSEKEIELPELEEELDNAEKDWECKESELSLKFQLDDINKLSDKKILDRVRKHEDYLKLWAEYIVAKSKLRRCKIDISRIHKEMHTLESMSKNISMEIKYNLR